MNTYQKGSLFWLAATF